MHYGTALVHRLVVSHRPIGGNRELANPTQKIPSPEFNSLYSTNVRVLEQLSVTQVLQLVTGI